MKQKACLFFAIFCLLFCQDIYANDLERLLPEHLVRQLLQNGEITAERFDSASLSMIPRHDRLERLLDSNQRNLNPNVIMEHISLYRKPGGSSSWTLAQRTALYNGIVALSTLSGLEYFSKSRNRMRIFYESSVVIDDPSSRNPRPDPSFQSPPAEFSIFARQRDSTFGDNVYRYTYYSDTSSFIVFAENMTNLNYGPVSVIDRGNLRSFVAVFDTGQYLLIYTASMAKASMLPGMRQRVGESVSNRAIALLSWFNQIAGRSFR